MKTLVVVFVALVVILATIEADGARQRAVELDQRKLLTDDTDLGRKSSAGAPASKPGAAGDSTQSNSGKTNSNTNDDHDDVNDSYENYGHGPTGSETENRRIFTSDHPERPRP
ncbi:hypothetical protein O6P43_003688 [Quillaja saponaria]|uniref:Secreted protein n=1 Tax=Quillaja saponaria TaxID=32244 RepID=A0AAD7VLP7_QUISA|nr:hypothetical protein O6P43_003688 [Quillaja saponaria]